MYHSSKCPSKREPELFWFILQELSKAFEDDAKDTRKTQLLLSANVASLRSTINRAYEVEKISL